MPVFVSTEGTLYPSHNRTEFFREFLRVRISNSLIISPNFAFLKVANFKEGDFVFFKEKERGAIITAPQVMLLILVF